MRHSLIAKHILILNMLKRSMTGVAIVLHGQQSLAEERKKFGIGRSTVGADNLFTHLSSVVRYIHNTYCNLLPIASHRSHGNRCVSSQRFFSALNAIGTSISRLLSTGMTFCR
jgi:hypothetical protein